MSVDSSAVGRFGLTDARTCDANQVFMAETNMSL